MVKHLKILTLLLFPFCAIAGNSLLFNQSDQIIHIGGTTIETLEDKDNKFSVLDVINSKGFKVNSQNVPNFGVSSSSFWLKFEIKNATSYNKLLLNLAYPNIDEVEFFSLNSENKFTVVKMGKCNPFSLRNYSSPSYIFDLSIPLNTSVTCYLKIKSGGQIMAPLTLGVPTKILDTIKTENLIIGIYCGIILVMFFYNLFIYFAARDKVYLYYVVYILIVGLVQLCLLGYTFQYLWPNSVWLATHSVYLLSALVGIGVIEFAKVFLQTKRYVPGLHKGLLILNLIYIIYILLDLFNLSAAAYNVIQLCAMLLSLYLIFIAYKISKKGYRPARYFLLAWSIFLVGVFVYALKDVGILPYNNFTLYTMPIGSAIEATLLSFALADKINTFRKENERIIKEQNITLELKVKERTEELETTYKNLKEAESNLINAEKMASLGQLTAGISHEINNPINFVVSNIKPLKRDISEILLILSKYIEIKDGKAFGETQKEILVLQKKIDIDYLTEEINLLLQGIDEGANRTAEIIKGLKNFARADETNIKKANIHEGIDATLSLLNSNIQNEKIEIIKHYGKLPPIDCYPGKLNQVFMNLFNNAIQAISSQNDLEKTQSITIETKASEKDITIKITDTGKGIPKTIQSKIFEPFFTTKEVGEGTGLGLSIVYGIIKNHEGDVKVESEEGKGSTFIITLPIQLHKKYN